ncbi:MAG: GMP synthase [Confluentimicrobium sp.]|uniref:VIT1/CCC1 transporter family protein n=1 Tax=Actibacterium sp. TaxID=1872125 RepID=UPI000C6A1244|nr:VIT1/CCC1 transporter family protein [Actibacterium sp.]MBC55703.1 GMP synthase [Actibacterium sp.]|tara:strand:+ start:2559 stop:3275 length:717 start_codon:yes stop_codon:yes gene_type:complete
MPSQTDAVPLRRVQEYLKQIVYGGNDGIVTTFAIVAGFAGASAEGVAQIGGLAVLIFGLANLFADAVSMGLGEFLSARSQRELYRGQRADLLHRMSDHPAAERAHLGRLLHARGMSQSDADAASALIARQPTLMAELIMKYDSGLNDPDGETPALNGLVTFLAFVAFGVIPIVPYFLMEATDHTFRLSLLATLTALAALGALRGNATGEPRLRSIGETVTVGSICALVAYLVGMIVGG